MAYTLAPGKNAVIKWGTVPAAICIDTFSMNDHCNVVSAADNCSLVELSAAGTLSSSGTLTGVLKSTALPESYTPDFLPSFESTLEVYPIGGTTPKRVGTVLISDFKITTGDYGGQSPIKWSASWRLTGEWTTDIDD